MDEYTSFETVKEKLITAGIKEIENHGITDFSLRRVATSCNVSCAAPYKHFASKENFISEIIKFIYNKWSLLNDHIIEIFDGDIKKQILEICIAYIKFWIANPNFRSVLMLKPSEVSNDNIKNTIADCMKKLIHDYCIKNNISAIEEEQKLYITRSLIYGTIIMLDNGEIENTDSTIKMIRECIDREFK